MKMILYKTISRISTHCCLAWTAQMVMGSLALKYARFSHSIA